jgi:hypothetical protein
MAAAPVAAPAPAPVAGAPTSEPAADDIGDALARIGDLRDRGLITPEEYAAKRAEMLDRL